VNVNEILSSQLWNSRIVCTITTNWNLL